MKKNYNQQILIISILTLTIATLWVYLSIHRALKKSEKPVLTPQETRVLNPQLDETVFEELGARKI
jgi:hypothetical protein